MRIRLVFTSASWSRQTDDQPGADWVSRRREDDRDHRCRLLGRKGWWGSHRNNDFDLHPDELGRDFRVALVASLRPAILDCNVVAFDPAKFA